MSGYSQAIERLMDEFAKLPGIGARTAERLAFHVLNSEKSKALALADAIRDVKTNVHACSRCFNLAEGEQCEICANSQRDQSIICVVEQPRDVMSLESTGVYNGAYHVLMGHISPLDGLEAEDLTIGPLIERVRAGGISEVILATNPTVSGDATALHISAELEPLGVKITRLARGLPSGGQIEYANKSILSDALNQRRQTK